jgi:hypothetical protein
MSGAAVKDKNGRRGTEGCKLLSYLPKEMISFEWNFPPKIPSLRYSDARTHVVIRFRDLGDGRVQVDFSQLGWQEGDDWDAGYDYFDKAWSWVLEQLGKRFPGETKIKPRVFRTAKDGASNESRLSFFAPFVGGEWHATSTEPDGGVFHPKVVYEWGLGGKIVKARSFVITDKGEDLVYEMVCGWHPQKQAVVFRSYSAWDSLYDGTIRIVGDTLEYEWDGFRKEKVTRYRQEIRMLDDDRYSWVVFAKTDEDWEQIKEMIYHREPS